MRTVDAFRAAPGAPAQSGAALVYVLGLVAVVGILVGMTWRIIRANDAIAALETGDAQARLMALAGADFALAKIGPPGPKQNLAYSAEDLRYRLDDSDRVFDLTVRTHGMFARARSIGRTGLPRPGRSREYAALLGQSLDPGKLPALGLLKHEGNMVLAGNASVTGPVMLWRGDVRKATDYNVRWTGSAGHAGALWDSTAAAWTYARVDFGRADSWIREQEALLASRDFDRDSDFDSGMVRDIRLADSAGLDSDLSAARIVAARVLRVGPGARLRDCKLLSPRIVIDAGAVVERCLVYATRTLDIRGGRIEGGQFVAGDSLRIASDGTLKGFPVFYAQGRMKPDSSMAGALIVEKANGEGLFFSACRGLTAEDQGVRLIVGSGARLIGLLYTPGFADVRGSLEGSLICRNLKFEYKGTIWGGHLKDARIAALPAGTVIPAPLLFPAFPPASFSARGP